ncbi:nuclear transport factor 2 family protein [Halosolutus gelatinilyticus]|uniref:nuclear transport factor 2 family protein n=1 Tax=Halosolutus gelatinilyticus TaxID=2931975 RepID=UPI001FF2B807|nr:nuclear transport factor 2 family protein [Halosolutus gelatinilyticus]
MKNREQPDRTDTHAMPEISIEEDCGNSPRKQFLSDFYVAFVERNEEAIRSMLTDDVRLAIIGEETLDGSQSVVDSMDLFLDGISEITVNNIITHGDMAAVTGVITADSGDTHAFCEVFEFEGHTKGAKIESIDSYVVEMG